MFYHEMTVAGSSITHCNLPNWLREFRSAWSSLLVQQTNRLKRFSNQAAILSFAIKWQIKILESVLD